MSTHDEVIQVTVRGVPDCRRFRDTTIAYCESNVVRLDTEVVSKPEPQLDDWLIDRYGGFHLIETEGAEWYVAPRGALVKFFGFSRNDYPTAESLARLEGATFTPPRNTRCIQIPEKP